MCVYDLVHILLKCSLFLKVSKLLINLHVISYDLIKYILLSFLRSRLNVLFRNPEKQTSSRF